MVVTRSQNTDTMANIGNIHLIEKFYGDKLDAERFINMFRTYVELNKTKEEDMVHLFRILLSGPASVWASSFTNESFRTLQDIERLFRQRFIHEEGAIFSLFCQFKERKMGPSESAAQYIDIMVRNGQQLQKSESDIIYTIIANVSEKLRSSILMANPKTIQELRTAAAQATAIAMGDSQPTAPPHVAPVSKMGEMEELKQQMSVLTETVKQLASQVQQRPLYQEQVQPSAYYGHRYGNPTPRQQPANHQQRQQQYRPKRKGDFSCFNCGKANHLAKECRSPCKYCNNFHKYGSCSRQ